MRPLAVLSTVVLATPVLAAAVITALVAAPGCGGRPDPGPDAGDGRADDGDDADDDASALGGATGLPYIAGRIWIDPRASEATRADRPELDADGGPPAPSTDEDADADADEARDIRGFALVQLLVGADGRAQTVEVLDVVPSAYPAEVVRRDVRSLRFQVLRAAGGEPVPYRTSLRYDLTRDDVDGR